MKKSQWFLTASLAAIIAFTSLSVIASADEGEMPADRPMQQNKEEVQAAIASGDYNAFAEVAPEQMLEQITAENFSRFVEMHEHLEAAKAIADELGLKKAPKMQKKGGMMKGHLMKNRKEIREAVENGDYNAWVELHSQGEHEAKILEFITEENFYLLGELHEAIQNQDFETAKEIKAELGLPDRPAQGQRNR